MIHNEQMDEFDAFEELEISVDFAMPTLRMRRVRRPPGVPLRDVDEQEPRDD